jgi:hypothetical protein
MIRITAKQDGFRRAGMAHTKEPKEYPDGKFTREQMAALKAEPMLIVEEIEVPAAPAGRVATGKGRGK